MASCRIQPTGYPSENSVERTSSLGSQVCEQLFFFRYHSITRTSLSHDTLQRFISKCLHVISCNTKQGKRQKTVYWRGSDRDRHTRNLLGNRPRGPTLLGQEYRVPFSGDSSGNPPTLLLDIAFTIIRHTRHRVPFGLIRHVGPLNSPFICGMTYRVSNSSMAKLRAQTRSQQTLAS